MHKDLFKKISFVFAIFMIFLIPRVIGLGWDEWNVDAQRWMTRSDLFIKYLLRGDFAQTYQSYHPGVTLMWLSGISKWIFYSLFEAIKGYPVKLSSGSVYPEQFFLVAFIAKFPLVLTISALLTYSSVLISRIIKTKKYVLIFAILLSLEPFYLGINRFYHLTGLESAFVFSAVISIYYYVYGETEKHQLKYLILGGIFSGLAFLTKSSGLIVIPFLLGIIVSKLFWKKGLDPRVSLRSPEDDDPKKQTDTKLQSEMIFRLRFVLKSAGILLTSFVLTIFVFFPAMWVNPVGTVQNIFISGVEEKGFTDGPHPSILKSQYTYYYEILFIKSAGLTIISIIVSGIFIVRRKLFKSVPVLTLAVSYFFYYFTIMSIPSKQMTRYTSIVYPFIIMISSFGIYLLLRHFRKNKAILFSIIGAIALYYAVIFFSIYPNYSSFHSDLLGGYNGYSKIRKPYNDGEHYLQVGQYLNQIGKKDAYDYALIVTEGNKDISVKLGFLGQTYAGKIPSEINKKFKKIFYATDYTDIQDFPNCPKIKGFGHKWPDEFEFVYLFECEGN